MVINTMQLHLLMIDVSKHFKTFKKTLTTWQNDKKTFVNVE